MPTCIYNSGWGGKCKNESIEGDICIEHAKIKCGCGMQAIKECSKPAIGNHTCFNPVCDECDKTYTPPRIDENKKLCAGTCGGCRAS